jgi:excisionase family DNA binding protein
VLDRLLTVEEAADRLGTSARFIRRLILERRIAYTKLGRHVRIAPGDLDAFIRAGRVEVGAPLPGRSKKGRLMAHITRRQRNGKVRYLARYTDPSGRERAKSFTRKKDAERFLTGIENDKPRGTWTDPALGRVALADWYAPWRRQRWSFVPTPRPATRQGLAASTVRRAYQLFGKVLGAAVDAGMIAQNPCRRVPLPRIERREMRFLTPVEVARLADSIRAGYRALVLLGAYGGLRIGEMAGLRRGRVDWSMGWSRSWRSSPRSAAICISGRPSPGRLPACQAPPGRCRGPGRAAGLSWVRR